MRQLRRIDVILLAVLGPLWLLSVSLHGVRAAGGQVGWMPLVVTPVQEGPPVLSGFLAGAPPPEGAPEPGARLLRAGERDLVGAGRVDFVLSAWSQSDEALTFPLTFATPEGERTTRVQIRKVPFPLRTLPLVALTGLAAIAILLRGRGTAHARAWFLAGMAWSLQWSTFFGPAPWQTGLSLGLALVGSGFTFALAILALELFPPAVAPRSFLGRNWLWVFLVHGIASSSWLLGWPFGSGAGLRIIYALNIALVIAVVVVLARNYRKSDGGGRRQLKWVLYGFYVGLAPVLLAAGVAALVPSLTWVYEVAVAFAVAIPIGFLIAIVKDDFLDIDRLITETASYTLAAVGLLAVLLQSIPAAARSLSRTAELDEPVAQAMLLAALVGVALPARRALNPLFERVFYREQRRLESGLSQLRGQLDDAGDPEALFSELGRGLAELLRSEHCVIYARTGDRFGAVFAAGASVPPALALDNPLIGAMTAHGEWADGARWQRWRKQDLLDDESHQLLDSLAPEGLLPVGGEGALGAIVLLGPKRSGEIYGSRELAWLSAVTERAGRHLERFSSAQVLAHGQKLQSQLARYVPGAVQRTLESGDDVAAREREVSILFVDIRGYTSFSEGRSAEEIFETVSLYTETASGIVLRHGGAVVEFHGDGLMVVFGAPLDLSDKERSAVEAAREIAVEVPKLQVPGTRLSVGVGIATGPAFVGNIQSVDRLIWGAIGNTTNLAARIQGQTRPLRAWVAVDATTFQRAGTAVQGFVERGPVDLRGRSDPLPLYVLPMEEPAF